MPRFRTERAASPVVYSAPMTADELDRELNEYMEVKKTSDLMTTSLDDIISEATTMVVDKSSVNNKSASPKGVLPSSSVGSRPKKVYKKLRHSYGQQSVAKSAKATIRASKTILKRVRKFMQVSPPQRVELLRVQGDMHRLKLRQKSLKKQLKAAKMGEFVADGSGKPQLKKLRGFRKSHSMRKQLQLAPRASFAQGGGNQSYISQQPWRGQNRQVGSNRGQFTRGRRQWGNRGQFTRGHHQWGNRGQFTRGHYQWVNRGQFTRGHHQWVNRGQFTRGRRQWVNRGQFTRGRHQWVNRGQFSGSRRQQCHQRGRFTSSRRQQYSQRGRFTNQRHQCSGHQCCHTHTPFNYGQ